MTGMITTRRRLLVCGLAGAGLALPGAAAAFAQAPRAAGRKLVVIILRGALDGLAALAPVGERRYGELRGELALAGGLPAPGPFVFHPALETLAGLFASGEALAVHAIATDYRERSHFEAQDRLEAATPAIRDGWMNRALALMGSDAPGAVGVGQSMPLLLRGSAPASTWAPAVLPGADDDTISRLMDLYALDPMLGPALARALETDAAASAMSGMSGEPGMAGLGARGAGPQAYGLIADAAGNILTAPGGPDAAVLSFDGWDTHVRQGAREGQLAVRLGALDGAISALRARLSQDWDRTAILVVTEFGRTVRINGAGGTDHGTGGAAFLMGGAVRGGRIIGDWPGLDRLHEDRDLLPANDLRSLFKAVLAEHWGLNRADLDRSVFPGAAAARPFEGLIA